MTAHRFLFAFFTAAVGLASWAAGAAPPQGYYRFPAVHGDTVVFTAEGDLWKVGIQGGAAQRLTTHLDQETRAAISPDGATVAFSARYEGVNSLYTMPLAGGLPVRHTYDGGDALAAGWTHDGKVLFATRAASTLPDWQLATLAPTDGGITLLPLSQASDGAVSPDGKTVFFTRPGFQGSSTKRYQGGTAQRLWSYEFGAAEAKLLTGDYSGTSKAPMWWDGRVYFLSDRDLTMNVWSFKPDGSDLRQVTKSRGWDVKAASMDQGRIVYSAGADLHRFDLATGVDAVIPITLTSDLDQEREHWLKSPADYLTSIHLSTNGDRVALTARGQVFVAPVRPGRLVTVTRDQSVRYRQAVFLPGGTNLLALSDARGEIELVRVPANGVGAPEALTSDGAIFRSDPTPSPDGKWIAFQDKNLELWLYNTAGGTNQRIAASAVSGFSDLSWSPDSQWLAYTMTASNQNQQILLHNVTNHAVAVVTSDRVNSASPAWSPDGKWLYFVSERHFESWVESPWGPREPEPFFPETAKLYLVSLTGDARSPFEPNDELHPPDDAADKAKDGDKKPEDKDKPKDGKAAEAKADDKATATAKLDVAAAKTDDIPVVVVQTNGLAGRALPIPAPPGNYAGLSANAKRLFWISRAAKPSSKPTLMVLDITNDDPKPKAFAVEISDYELSADGQKVLLHKGDDLFVVDASAAAPVKLEKAVDLKGWTFSFRPRDEWRQMFIESWRLMRDYFYDPKMHGIDWPAVRDKCQPLVDRVTDRAELSDLIADMVGELSALHIFVVGGDHREGRDAVEPAALGAVLARDDARGGWRIERLYQSDPDYPERAGPLARPGVNARPGDVIVAINGQPARTVPQPGALLRNQAGRQVLLTLRPAGAATNRDVIVKPLSAGEEADLRYEDWEYTRRLKVEELGKGEIGYLHLRAMGSGDAATWARDFYPVFNRQGLIIDVRHNGGGNIDSWLLEKLMRKAWFFWQPRVGANFWNMPFAFHGHMTVLCDEYTGSDGEAFTEGFRRLGLGKAIGTRTWGGEVWLDFDNTLVDKGIASAAEIGVYGPEGKWLIEGHGVDPDIVVDNLPHATFGGEDAQLTAAVEHLRARLKAEPVVVPPMPPRPNKAPRP
jgi:tricorn protease